jgi:hypothetical protein
LSGRNHCAISPVFYLDILHLQKSEGDHSTTVHVPGGAAHTVITGFLAHPCLLQYIEGIQVLVK